LSSPQQQRTIVVAGPGADGGWKRGGRRLTIEATVTL
jgi:hypothetical protein